MGSWKKVSQRPLSTLRSDELSIFLIAMRAQMHARDRLDIATTESKEGTTPVLLL